MKNIYTVIFCLLGLVTANAQTTQVQFINNSADSAMSMVKVLMNNDLKKDSLSYRKATPFITTAGDSTYTITFESKRNAAKTVSLTQTLQAGKKYVLVLNGVTNDTAYERNPDSISTQLTIVLIDQSTLGTPSSDEVTLAFVSGSTDAPAYDLYANDTLNTLLADDDSLHQVSPVTVADTMVKLRLKTADGSFNISTFLFSLTNLGGQITTALTSGFLSPGSNSNGTNFNVYVVDSLGNVLNAQNVSVIRNASSLVEQMQVFPNPAADYIQLSYKLAQASTVNYRIFNIKGEMMQGESLGVAAKGNNEIRIALQDFPAGMYFLNLQSELSGKTLGFIVK